jgi:hypothetical protein
MRLSNLRLVSGFSNCLITRRLTILLVGFIESIVGF